MKTILYCMVNGCQIYEVYSPSPHSTGSWLR